MLLLLLLPRPLALIVLVEVGLLWRRLALLLPQLLVLIALVELLMRLMWLLWWRLVQLLRRLLALIVLVLLLPVQLLLGLLWWRLAQLLSWLWRCHERLPTGASKCGGPVCATCSAANRSPM